MVKPIEAGKAAADHKYGGLEGQAILGKPRYHPTQLALAYLLSFIHRSDGRL